MKNSHAVALAVMAAGLGFVLGRGAAGSDELGEPAEAPAVEATPPPVDPPASARVDPRMRELEAEVQRLRRHLEAVASADLASPEDKLAAGLEDGLPFADLPDLFLPGTQAKLGADYAASLSDKDAEARFLGTDCSSAPCLHVTAAPADDDGRPSRFSALEGSWGPNDAPAWLLQLGEGWFVQLAWVTPEGFKESDPGQWALLNAAVRERMTAANDALDPTGDPQEQIDALRGAMSLGD